MNSMSDNMMQGMSYHMIFGWGAIALVVAALAVLIAFFARRAPADSLLIADLATGRPGADLIGRELNEHHELAVGSALDTIFILPDISHYTKFMTGSHFSFAHAQHIVFCLINAMIVAATRTVELSKLEGDAALFYVDAQRHSDAVIGDTVMDILAAFFTERERLKHSNLCPCRACRHIAELDLKVFVHRGKASRFQFRGTVDHFGTDVIIIHRMMKNGVDGHRYIMVTDAAAGSIVLPTEIAPSLIEEDIEHVGRVRASVYPISDEDVGRLTGSGSPETSTKFKETLRKLRQNAASVARALRRSKGRH